MAAMKRSASRGPAPLTAEQVELRDRLQRDLHESLEKIHSNRRLANGEIDRLGETAAQLHQSLKDSGHPVRHHRYMIENRGMKPDEPEFYRHIHPIEDLLKFIDEQSANDDPEDQTLNNEFTFNVFCRRWNHPDTYRLTRTKAGWNLVHIQSISAGRDGRVGGKPGTGLFQLLDHDSINYPEELPGYLEWLWERAAKDGLSPDDVQAALTALADWVSLVEKNSPGDIFAGFK